MGPTSDEELQFMEDVEFLHSQLITVGDPVDANFAKKFKVLEINRWACESGNGNTEKDASFRFPSVAVHFVSGLDQWKWSQPHVLEMSTLR